jgi:hypothetical protein
MTATGSPSHEGRDGMAGLGSCVGEQLMTRPPGSPVSALTPLKSQGLTLTEGAYTVPTDDGGYIPAKYSECVEVFSKAKEEALPPHRSIDHAIDLESGYKLPYGRIYNLSEVKLRILKAYIETNLANGFIQRSSSPVAEPILFVKQKDGRLQLSVDYRALNSGTIKNHYQLPLISEMLDRLYGAQIFTKLDLRNAYHLIQIKEDNEYKMAILTRYGQFEYQVMPFGLTNEPATFQPYIDECLWPYIDDFTLCYRDDIQIYSTNEKEHEEQV